MSATLGAMLALQQPRQRIVIVERAAGVATESSQTWNNAGTGHSGFCELNYMPDPADPTGPARIATQFAQSRRWWDRLAERGLLDPETFLHTAAHMNVVFGDRDIAYLRRRFQTLRADPLFAGLEYTEDPDTVARWAPLVMAGRAGHQRVAATRHPGGTDIDFGSLTSALMRIVTDAGGRVLLGHEVRTLRRTPEGSWRISGRNGGDTFEVCARRVFVGAGGNALRLLQRARLPEVRGYGVLPVGAAFLRCSDPDVVAMHDAKMYGQAPLGAPPISVPHLDKRIVEGTGHLMFGPYATFSTKLLRHGRLTDFFATLRWHNVVVLATAVWANRPLVGYLIGQLLSGRRRTFATLARYYPRADPGQWERITAGQRAQLVIPDARGRGALVTGTELVISADGTIAGLLGASPGASTAVSVMVDVLQRWGYRADTDLLAS